MAEYIEREALEVALNHRLNFLMAENGEYDHYTSGFDEAVTRVENFPAADVAPVRHGRWDIEWDAERDPKRLFVRIICSKCGLKTGQKSNYCPSCGAKMDGGAD